MLEEIKKEIVKKQKELNKLKDDKSTYQTNMTSLNASLSESFLPEKNYKQIMYAKIEYQKSIDEITKKMRVVKTDILQLNMDKEDLEPKINIEGINKNIQDLKDKYFNFYTDKTRIASMRKMAEEFIIDLDKITK